MSLPLLLYRVATAGRHPGLSAIALEVIFNAGGLAGLRIDQLHIRNINIRFLLDNSAATIGLLVGPLVAFDDAGTFDFYFALCRSHFQHAATFAFIAPGNHYYLIVLLDLCSLGSRHDLNDLRRQ